MDSTSDLTHGAPVRARAERDLSWALLALLAAFAATGFVDPDLPGHLRYGLDHLASHTLARTDPYGYGAPGAPWINHEWLSELVLAAVYRVLGGPGLVLVQLAAWTTTGALVLRLVRRQTAGPGGFLPGAVAYLAFVALAYVGISVRPQLFTYLGFALLLTLLEGARAGRPGLLLVAGGLMLPWVALHGGFLAGLGVLGLTSAGFVGDWLLGRGPSGDLPPPPALARRLALCGVLGTLLGATLTLANPYGLDLHRFLVRSLGTARAIGEWQAPQADAQGALALVTFLGAAAALAARARREPGRVPLAHALLLAVTGLLALRHLRHLPFLGMSAAVVAAGPLADLYRTSHRARVEPPCHDLDPGALRRLRLGAALVLAPSLALALAWPGRDLLALRLHPFGPSPAPTGAVQHLRALAREGHGLRGNLLVEFDWAQLMIWELTPAARVFFDGRFRTVYPPAVEEAYFAFVAEDPAPGWRRALEAWPTEWVLLARGTPAARRMLAEPGWHVAYQDAQALLFARGAGAAPTPGEVPARLPFTAEGR